MEQLLAGWRAAEHLLAALLATGAETSSLRTQIAAFRARHAQLFAERMARATEPWIASSPSWMANR